MYMGSEQINITEILSPLKKSNKSSLGHFDPLYVHV